MSSLTPSTWAALGALVSGSVVAAAFYMRNKRACAAKAKKELLDKNSHGQQVQVTGVLDRWFTSFIFQHVFSITVELQDSSGMLVSKLQPALEHLRDEYEALQRSTQDVLQAKQGQPLYYSEHQRTNRAKAPVRLWVLQCSGDSVPAVWQQLLEHQLSSAIETDLVLDPNSPLSHDVTVLHASAKSTNGAAAAPLIWKVVALHNTSTGSISVVFVVHHFVGDGMSGSFIAQRFVQLVAQSNSSPSPPCKIFPPVEQVVDLTPGLGFMLRELLYDKMPSSLLGLRLKPPRPDYTLGIVDDAPEHKEPQAISPSAQLTADQLLKLGLDGSSVRTTQLHFAWLPPEATAALRLQAKSHDKAITLHMVFCAASTFAFYLTIMIRKLAAKTLVQQSSAHDAATLHASLQKRLPDQRLFELFLALLAQPNPPSAREDTFPSMSPLKVTVHSPISIRYLAEDRLASGSVGNFLSTFGGEYAVDCDVSLWDVALQSVSDLQNAFPKNIQTLGLLNYLSGDWTQFLARKAASFRRGIDHHVHVTNLGLVDADDMNAGTVNVRAMHFANQCHDVPFPLFCISTVGLKQHNRTTVRFAISSPRELVGDASAGLFARLFELVLAHATNNTGGDCRLRDVVRSVLRDDV